MRKLIAVLLAFIFAASSSAQQIGQNRPANAQDNYTMSVKVQLVVETVVVKDKQGNPVHGLTAKDFAVTEDDVPQTIRFCEHQDLAETAKPLPPSKRSEEDLKIYKRLAREQIAPETIDNERYKNRRLLALYFDMSAMRPADQLRALQAAEQFIRTQMTSVDLVSIMRYNTGSVDILQDFTQDRDRLLSILETMIVGEGQDSAEEVDDASSADTGAAFGQDDSEFNIFNTDRQLSALQTAAQMLGQLNEKKSLIYFAGGMRLNGIDNQAQMHATVDAAIKAGVSFWPIDARGLVAQAPLGDATQGSQGNAGIYTGAAANGRHRSLPVLAGHALLPRSRHRRQGTARHQRPRSRNCPGAGGHLRLLHHRLLHHQSCPQRPLPPRKDRAQRRTSKPSSIIARDITPTRNSANSPPSTKSASSKMR